jgi:hypothetical protein
MTTMILFEVFVEKTKVPAMERLALRLPEVKSVGKDGKVTPMARLAVVKCESLDGFDEPKINDTRRQLLEVYKRQFGERVVIQLANSLSGKKDGDGGSPAMEVVA